MSEPTEYRMKAIRRPTVKGFETLINEWLAKFAERVVKIKTHVTEDGAITGIITYKHPTPKEIDTAMRRGWS